MRTILLWYVGTGVNNLCTVESLRRMSYKCHIGNDITSLLREVVKRGCFRQTCFEHHNKHQRSKHHTGSTRALCHEGFSATHYGSLLVLFSASVGFWGHSYSVRPEHGACVSTLAFTGAPTLISPHILIHF